MEVIPAYLSRNPGTTRRLSQPRWEGLMRGVDRAWRTRPGLRKDAPVTGCFGSTPLRIESVNVGAYVSGGRAPLWVNGGNEKVAGLRIEKADAFGSVWCPPEPYAGVIQHSGRGQPARRQRPADDRVAVPANVEVGEEPMIVDGGADVGNAGGGEEPPRDPGGGP